MEMRTKKVPRVEPGKAYEVGLGRPTFIDDCHALAVSWITGYRLVDREGVRRDVAPRHDRVATDYSPGGKCRAQNAVRPVGFGDDQQARRFLVQAMDHARPLGIPGARDAAAAPQQGVNQRPAPVAWGWMNDHSGGLVDDQQRLVLVDDVDRNVLT